MQPEIPRRHGTSRKHLSFGIGILDVAAFLALIGLGIAAGGTKLVGISEFGSVTAMLGVGFSRIGEFIHQGVQKQNLGRCFPKGPLSESGVELFG